METKTSKIKSCKFIKEWQGDKGLIYYHEIVLENGDSGQIGTKERVPDKLNVGQELIYTIESSSYGNKIKAVNQQGGGFKGKPQRDPKEQMISFATAYTKDLVVAGKVEMREFEAAVRRMYNIMKSLYEGQ